MSEEQEHQGPPWIRPDIQQQVQWRDRDIVISVPAKSGTTWMMNIVHQLLNGGTPDFEDIYAEVPWIEFIGGPEQSPQELLDRVEAMPEDRPRAFKSHSAPPALPFLTAESGKQVKYIVLGRNPEEALVSFKVFLDRHRDEWFELWGMPKAAMSRPDFPAFYQEVIDANGMQGMFFGFLAAWWPLRNEDNVLMLHFADLKQDHEGSIRRIAEFLGIEPESEEWDSILEYTGFPWMKANQGKFEASSLGEVPVLESGAMIRRGRLGDARSDGMTEEIAAHLREAGRRICPDEAALEWYYRGGPVSP